MPPELNGRVDFWNIGYPLGALVYLASLIAILFVGYSIYRRSRIWRLGAPNPDLGPWIPRLLHGLRALFVDSLAHRRFIRRRERYPGLMHFLIFWGMLILFVATTLDAVEFNAHRYLGFEVITATVKVEREAIWDLGGVMLMAGIAMAAYRRYIIKPPRLNTLLENGVLLVLLMLMAVSGFALQSLRMAATELEPSSFLFNPDWARWSFFSWFGAQAIRGLGASLYAIEVSHFVLWWLHAGLMSATFIYGAWRFGPLMHIFISPLNLVMRSSVTRPKGALQSMGNLDELVSFGANDISQLSSKQLLDYDSCTNCGRCETLCPAWATGKPLSPRKLIQDAKGFMLDRAPLLLQQTPGTSAPNSPISLIHDVITTDVLWSCTTCRACMEACPVAVEHIDSIIAMRRYLTMEEGDVPGTAMDAMNSIEQRGHPWKGTQATRSDWTDGIDAVTMAEDPEHDVLLWVGCTSALNGRNQATARAMASVLKVAGVRYRILGSEETCTGDPARRMGNEYLFQMQAEQNIAMLKGYGVTKILTLCPHCFNTMKNEYPQLDGKFEVVHYTEYVAGLIREGRIKPIGSVFTTLAYHDSCYIGRHNDIYDAPREIAESIPGVTLVEMPDEAHHQRSSCCGAGGGQMWMEEKGTRVNHARTDQFLRTEADTVAVSCPFCLQMMEEGINSKGLATEKSAKDVLEILAESLSVQSEPD